MPRPPDLDNPKNIEWRLERNVQQEKLPHSSDLGWAMENNRDLFAKTMNIEGLGNFPNGKSAIKYLKGMENNPNAQKSSAQKRKLVIDLDDEEPKRTKKGPAVANETTIAKTSATAEAATTKIKQYTDWFQKYGGIQDDDDPDQPKQPNDSVPIGFLKKDREPKRAVIAIFGPTGVVTYKPMAMDKFFTTIATTPEHDQNWPTGAILDWDIAKSEVKFDARIKSTDQNSIAEYVFGELEISSKDGVGKTWRMCRRTPGC